MGHPTRILVAALVLFCAVCVVQAENETSASPSATTRSARNRGASLPNILFVIMDDVGIDQMHVFGYGGPGRPQDAGH